jgi:hypothetical protein
MKRFCYQDYLKQISQDGISNGINLNGIDVFFEKGEKAHGGDRIVRIGCNDKPDNHVRRIGEYFSPFSTTWNSSFCNDVYRAFVRKEVGDTIFGKQWETWKKRLKRLKECGFETASEEALEIAVEYMRNKMSFVVFNIDFIKIQKLKAKLINTVSTCDCCSPSDNWIGKYAIRQKSTKDTEKIRKSGLWQTINNLVLSTRKFTSEELLTESDWLLLEKAAVR